MRAQRPTSQAEVCIVDHRRWRGGHKHTKTTEIQEKNGTYHEPEPGLTPAYIASCFPGFPPAITLRAPGMPHQIQAVQDKKKWVSG